MSSKFLKYSFLLFVLATISIGQLLAGKSPIKYGKPEIEDLEMKVYDLDSTAEAVILCNYGYFNSTRFEFTQIIRIKILKKSGTDWGNRKFSSMGKEANVKGKTFNLENGEIVESKLKNESIFKERVIGNYYSTSIAMPNVKVGSVIDIAVTNFGIPQKWRFQELIPVRYSELIIESSPYVDYQQNFFGFLSFDESTQGHWLMTKVPAFKIEPYMDSYKNYISKVEFDIRSISFPGYYEDFASTWEQVGETLLESEYFGDVIQSGSGYLKEIEEEVNNTCKTDFEKVKASYEKIKMIKWNDECNNYSSINSLGFVFKKKIGNSADVNLSLLKLLNRLDIKAYPVVLSTRENGQLSPIFPSLNKLNYTICCAVIDDQKIFLDPTEQKLPLGILPERVLNNYGRLIYSKEKTELISLATDKKDIEKVFQQLKLNPDMSVTGKRVVSYEEYGAFKKRTELDSFNSDEDYLNDCETKFSGLTINDFEIKDRDNIYKRLIETWAVDLSRQVEEIGDLVMINLNMFDQLKENPFKMEKRDCPVNYPYCTSRQNTTMIELPAGYEISEVPDNMRLVLPNNEGSFAISYSVQANLIILNCKISIDKEIFLPQEYLYLREFFTQIVKKQAEPIMLKKI